MVCYNEDLEIPARGYWPSSPVLKKPVPASTVPCTQKSLLRRTAKKEKAPSRIYTSSSSFALDSSSFDIDGISGNDGDQMLRDMADNMIGRNMPFQSPFGMKAQVYVDYTASGKSLQCIEHFIHKHVMPTYGNTHTTTSVTGLHTTSFREEARQIIANAVNASESKDAVIFAGQGCTSAINKLVTALGITRGRRHHRASKRPVVFTCPFSHHSNLLPWRESPCADEIQIPESERGGLDLNVLERQLQRHQHRPLKIGSFAAASNLTGMLIDVDKVSKLLHKYGALACWDYATCAPYVDIDMNPKNDPKAYKDAVFFSGHKFVGGPGSPGVLIVKTNLMNNEVPTMPGGGTVLFVTEKAHNYLSNKVEREEGGTPDILGSIRLGLAFQLKQRIGPQRIMNLERQHVRRVRRSLGRNKNIVMLGRQTDDIDQLPIFSLLIRFGDRFLHHNFVCALLNDMFGIQARGGCQCAGPFGSRLLGLSRQHIVDLGLAVVGKNEILKPGAVRISFPYFADEDEVSYVLEAVHFVANDGWKFFPQYDFNCRTGVWRHMSRAKKVFMKKQLSEMHLSNMDTARASVAIEPIRNLIAHRRQNLTQAARLADLSIQRAAESDFFHAERVANFYEGLRWFAYPSEAVDAFQEFGVKPSLSDEICGPCQPQRYFDPAINHVWNGVPTLATMKRHRMAVVASLLQVLELDFLRGLKVVVLEATARHVGIQLGLQFALLGFRELDHLASFRLELSRKGAQLLCEESSHIILLVVLHVDVFENIYRELERRVL
ncbi:hypothetical protein PsorP6_006254 [Peronosclerospora sorghi]|uniref:Uncharacterized protein n=1 Tax=Peronosclerospora sorghi TaxID=230839 RepID=A0ACC0W412_9STRA|nr:hypothetical protein PsorP6_006254 [Peronosclerospora sorghi]